MSIFVSQYPISTTTVTTFTGSTGVANVLSANNNRTKFQLFLTGSTVAYLTLSSSGTPSATSCSLILRDGDYYQDYDYKGTVRIAFASQSNTTYLFVTDLYK